ncbi:hypothetical protein M9H77_11485 [Catharanthus roseus]|uniref:Uncharacterized protein n=1 Tax=Catharanthus roseus TaxID=4058 RepID=A0ACC0BEQ9_CATRO|nr:hypothetical protein M9H77_11485 [Catharanthus roseus]
MFVLKRIPMDGTFNQHAPLCRLVGAKDSFSYDLSSATDRWPLILMHDTVMYLFDKSFASVVVCFVVDQLLGYYSSWALFALTHHIIVWLTAEEAMMFADKQVGPVYKSIINDLGVKISAPKSIISNSECIEYAKRFMVNGLKDDLSPIPVPAEIVQKYDSDPRFDEFSLLRVEDKRRVGTIKTDARRNGKMA